MDTTLKIAQKNIKEMMRNMKSYWITFVLPIVFMGVFAMAFGDPIEDTYSIGIVGTNDESVYQEAITTSIEDLEYDSGSKMFNVNKAEVKKEVEESLNSGDILGYLEFGETPGDLQLFVANNNQSVPAMLAIVRSVVDQVDKRPPSNLSIQSVELSDQDSLSGFQFIAPGLIIYGLVIMISQVGVEFAQITEKGYIFRYFTAKVSAWEIIAGYFLYYLLLGVIQISLLLGSALLFGMNMQGRIIDIFILGIPTVLFTIGLGLIVGSIVNKPDPAGSLGTIIGIVLGFLSGSFIWTTRVLWLPTTQAAEGIIQIVQYGQSITQLLDKLVIVSIWGIITFIIGALVFKYKKLAGV